jgi:hypothetical protein
VQNNRDIISLSVPASSSPPGGGIFSSLLPQSNPSAVFRDEAKDFANTASSDIGGA